MKASVVIPTHNSHELLDNCLRSMRHQRFADGDSIEVVVVDDGSTDATSEVVRGHKDQIPGLSYLHLPRSAASSRGAARNAGARAATGDVLVFLDGDQIAPVDFAARHLHAHRSADRVAVIGFRSYLDPGPSDVDAFCRTGDESLLAPVVDHDMRLKLLQRLASLPGAPATSWHLFFSCNISVRREPFWAVGGGSEEFFGWGLEDSELGWKLSRHGCEFVFDKANVVYHQGTPTVKKPDVYAGWLQNLNTFMRIHDYPMDVVLQKILAPAFDADRRADWIECYERFERAVRVAEGIPCD